MELIEFELEQSGSDAVAGPQRVEVRTVAKVASSVAVVDVADKERWRELSEYVVGKILEIHGPFPRDEGKESGIFKNFIGRWGFDNAMAIARCAFEAHGGMWYNSPVKIGRFTKGNDPYFAVQIAGLLGIHQ
jgi:hypothetical protein